MRTLTIPLTVSGISLLTNPLAKESTSLTITPFQHLFIELRTLQEDKLISLEEIIKQIKAYCFTEDAIAKVWSQIFTELDDVFYERKLVLERK